MQAAFNEAAVGLRAHSLGCSGSAFRATYCRCKFPVELDGKFLWLRASVAGVGSSRHPGCGALAGISQTRAAARLRRAAAARSIHKPRASAWPPGPGARAPDNFDRQLGSPQTSTPLLPRHSHLTPPPRLHQHQHHHSPPLHHAQLGPQTRHLHRGPVRRASVLLLGGPGRTGAFGPGGFHPGRVVLGGFVSARVECIGGRFAGRAQSDRRDARARPQSEQPGRDRAGHSGDLHGRQRDDANRPEGVGRHDAFHGSPVRKPSLKESLVRLGDGGSR